MEQLRVGVIGVGQMGTKHARVYSQMREVELVALADLRLERAQQLGRELHVPKVYSDYQELLALTNLDAVSICTPDDLHRDPVVDAARAGKHILLEKPLATNLTEAQEMVKVVHRAGVKAMVAHLLRFDPRYTSVKEAIDHGELGEIIYIISHRNSPYTEGPRIYKPGTSLTMHVAVHDLDLIDWFMPSEPVRVFAQAAEKLLREKRMQDAVTALFTFGDGAIASVNYAWCLPDQSVTRLDARMEVVGTKGAAYIGAYHGQGVLMAKEAGVVTPDLHHGPVVNGRVRGDLREEIYAFVNCIANDTPPPITMEEALRSVALGQAILESLARQAPVNVKIPNSKGGGDQ